MPDPSSARRPRAARVRWPKSLQPAPPPAPIPREPISLRVDAPVLAWFRAHSPRYQTHMVAVLRAYVARMRGDRAAS